MRKILLLSALLLASCSKDYVEDIDNPTPPVDSFTTLSERYSPINETTGYFKGQEFFTEYFSQIFIASNIDIPFTLDSSGDRIQYRAFGKNIVVTDINGDSKQDIVAVVNSFCSNHPEDYAYHSSKLVVIYDYKLTASKEVINLNSFHITKMEVNDFNSDSISDVLLFKHDTYKNFYVEQEDGGGNVNYPPGRPTVVYHNGSTLKTIDVGIPGDSHYGTSGDVDNDGDIDFVYWPIPGEYNDEPTNTLPYIALNDGNFNFSLKTLEEDPSWFTTGYDLFDINSDNNLDLILGWRIGSPLFANEDWFYHNLLSNPVIMFGDGTGSFSLSNSLEIPNKYLDSRGYSASILGYGFTDYDNDGDIDILISTTRDEPGGSFTDGRYYDNYYLILYRNDNNSSYTDVTESDIIGSFNNDYSFPNFYHIRTIDVDDDGDYDILPDAIANWGNIQYGTNLKWLNNSGKFFRN